MMWLDNGFDGFDRYTAPVRCVNCGFTGEASIPVGKDVFSKEAVCPLCRVGSRLRPDNEHWHEDRRVEHDDA